MGFSYRKSFKLAPGVRMTLSKSGIGYSVGGHGVRVTKRARGGIQATFRVPGTGISYTSSGNFAGRHKRPEVQAAEIFSNRTRRREAAVSPTSFLDRGSVADITGPSQDNARRSRWRSGHGVVESEKRARMRGNTPMNEVPRQYGPIPRPGTMHPQTNDSAAGQAVAAKARRSVSFAGLWYFLVTVLTLGWFAWVPFLHAARRLKTAKARRLALVYGVLDLLLYVLMAMTPTSGSGSTADNAVSTVGALLTLTVTIVGCVQLSSLRRMVYLGASPAQDNLATLDPAVRAVLAARARREEARSLAAKDPLLARELRIGRPDLVRNYDDGGLVDLNDAPAQVIAGVCGIPVEVAAAIVDARTRQSGAFSNVDELFVVADLPVAMWERIRDRAIVLS